MAVYHCHTHAISRSGKSGSALACAAYRSGEALQESAEKRSLSAAELAAYRTGEAVADASGRVHDYTRKSGVAHTEIVLPEGVDAPWAHDRAALWNQAEAAEKRINSRTAREWRVALPHELKHGERVALARDFAERIVERYGVAADVAVHAPSRSGDQRNWHAHILCTTRVIGNDGFGAKAQIEWSNTNLKNAGLPYSSLQVREMRMLWEERANEHLAQAGHENRIDHRSYAEQGIALEVARTVHVGQVYAEERDAVQGTERILPVERLDREQSARNADAIEQNPDLILDRVTASKSAFTRQDVASTLHRFVNGDWKRFDRTLEHVMASDSLVNLVESGRTADTGREVEPVWSTKAVATREAAMLDRAERLATSEAKGFDERSIERGIRAVERGGRTPFQLADEQRDAVRALSGDGQLAILRGVAGTGKTTALSAVREAADIEGARIVGGALAGKATRELAEGSGIESRTLASWERGWEGGFGRLERGDVFVMDEAGMVGAAQMARVMHHVEETGAKLILVGDERQLPAIEAGAAFRNVKERAEERDRVAEQDAGRGADASRTVAELTGVRRQADEWQREASATFGAGEAGEALDAYRARGQVRLHNSTEETRAAIVADYFARLDAAREAAAPKEGRASPLKERAGDRANEPDHIAMAYRHTDVDALNSAIRAERRERGELKGEAFYRTDRGVVPFATGDKVLLTRNDRWLGIANGERGRVVRAEADRLHVRFRDGREVRLDAEQYDGVRHGYAITIHRAQGSTADLVHVMAGRGMDAPLAYVSMTRHRAAAALHASRDHFRDYATLRESVSRERRAYGVGDYLPQRNVLAAVRERIAATDHGRDVASERDATDDHNADTIVNGTETAVREFPSIEGNEGVVPTTREGLREKLRAHAARHDPSADGGDRRERLRQRLMDHAAEHISTGEGSQEKGHGRAVRERGHGRDDGAER